MADIPFGELKTIDLTADDENGEKHVLKQIHYAFVIPCRDCRFYVIDPDPIDPGWPMMCEWTGLDMVRPSNFCAWGEKCTR